MTEEQFWWSACNTLNAWAGVARHEHRDDILDALCYAQAVISNHMEKEKNIMPNLKCKICGAEFPPIKERHYISRDLTKTGLAAAFGSSDEPAMFDSYDCQCCGSQVIAQPRKRQFDPRSEEVMDEDLLNDMSNETIAEHLGLNPVMVGHLRAAQSSSNSDEIFRHLNEILDKFDDLGNPNIIFDESAPKGEYTPTVTYIDLTVKRPSSLYFHDTYSAREALLKMRDVIEKNGFISIAEVDEILGGDHRITSKWGWTDLSKAHVVKSETCSGCYISFPAICDKPAGKEECKNGI